MLGNLNGIAVAKVHRGKRAILSVVRWAVHLGVACSWSLVITGCSYGDASQVPGLTEEVTHACLDIR